MTLDDLWGHTSFNEKSASLYQNVSILVFFALYYWYSLKVLKRLDVK